VRRNGFVRGRVILLAGLSAAGCGEATGPLDVVAVPFSGVTVSAGHSCALDLVGVPWCWGDNGVHQLGGSRASGSTPEPLADAPRLLMLSAGALHTCGLDTDERIRCWGWNQYGQLGVGSRNDFDRPGTAVGDARFVSVTAGDYHTCGLTAEGEALCWGRNDQGQLGNGGIEDALVPVPVAGGLRFHQLDAGGLHTCGVDLVGVAHCWGLNHVGQLGTGDTHHGLQPRRVADEARYTAVSAGFSHSCGLSHAGPRCWGSSVHGELGTGLFMPDGRPGSAIPAPVFQLAGAGAMVELAAGQHVTCGRDAGGRGYCWGRGVGGQLGNGQNVDRGIPDRVLMPSSTRLTSIAAGHVHACATTHELVVFCWGTGENGQLGNSSTISSSVPGRITLGGG
jgi:alpha-tubulin suppressor-like RCC1 family protein